MATFNIKITVPGYPGYIYTIETGSLQDAQNQEAQAVNNWITQNNCQNKMGNHGLITGAAEELIDIRESMVVKTTQV